MPSPMADRTALLREIRARLRTQLYDDSGMPGAGVAIYSLSDPRDIRDIHYVGQTVAPRRRLLQHLSAARLWLPDERPWWIRQPRLRPLYAWIRQIYADERRLPVMVVWEWAEASQARSAERARIEECLNRNLSLLNFENELRLRQRRRGARADC